MLLFIFRREALGQTVQTTINYLKNLRTLFGYAINEFCYEDRSFPKDFDGRPARDVVSRMKVLNQKLGHIYTRSTKISPQELFDRKAAEAKSMPDYAKMATIMENLFESIDGMLVELESDFGTAGKKNIRTTKKSTVAEKKVNML